MHFEELWEKSEKFCSTQEDQSLSDLFDEILLKITLYKKFDERKDEGVPEEILQVKNHTFGEILLSLSAISLKENINVYEALSIALKHRNIKSYTEKYNT